MVAELDIVLNELKELLLKKNQDYGDSFLKTLVEFGDVAFLVRVMDKVNRLVSLWKGGRSNFESFEDTVKDLAGYCVLYLCLKKLGFKDKNWKDEFIF